MNVVNDKSYMLIFPSDPVEAHPIVAITVDEVADDSPINGEKRQKWTPAGTEDSGLKPANAPQLYS